MTVSEVKEGIWKLDEWKLDEGFVPKPPLGIMPETLFIERRILELLGAMTRQIREDKPDIQAIGPGRTSFAAG